MYCVTDITITFTEVLLIPLYPFFYIQGLAMAAFSLVLAFDAVMSFISIFSNDFAEHVMSEWSD